MKIISGLLLFSALAMPVMVYADTRSPQQGIPYLSEHARGWFWYQRIIPKKKAKKKTEEVFSFPPKTMADEKRQIKVLKQRAIMKPTEKNLVAYIRLQNWVTAQASTFAINWKKVIWQHPELDFSIRHPVNSQALFIKQDETDLYNHRRIAQIGKQYGLFFIFRSTGAYSRKEAPMLKYFSSRYGLTVIPISQDGRGLPDYPDPRPDTGISAQLGTRNVPALFLVNPEKRTVIPLAYGLISENELVRRIITLTKRPSPPRPGYQESRRNIAYSHGGRSQ